MKTRLLIIVGIIFVSFFGTAYASITVTPFELEITSDDFYESFPNKHPYLIMKPSDSQQITIKITNNDSKSHTVNLFMAKETPRPDRHFVFEPSQLHLKSGETVSSILTVGPNPDADTGTTILHTLIVQSTSFGTKSFAFYVKITEQITPPPPDPIHRMGPDGIMFSPTAQFGLSESEVFEIIPYDILPPILSDEYSFQVMDGSKEEPRLIYSKELLSENTLYSEFWDSERLLINFEKEEYFTYDDYLQFLNPSEQQIQINGKDGISSSVQLQTTNGEKYLESRAVVFLDDVKLRLESNMSEGQLLRISESMIKVEKPIPNLTSITTEGFADKQISDDSCPVYYFLNYAWKDCGSIFTWSVFGIPLLAIIAVPIGSIFVFIIWRKRK